MVRLIGLKRNQGFVWSRFLDKNAYLLFNKYLSGGSQFLTAKKKYFVISILLVSIILLVIVTVSIVGQPQESTLTDEEKVMQIAVAYVEENYGTDYAINGGVSNGSITEHTQEGDTIYNYPTASFRIPSDYYEPGQIVNVMVEPDTEEIVKVYSTVSKGFPPYNLGLSKWETDVRRGESRSINITLTSAYTEEEVTVSFSLEVSAYNNTPVGSNYPSPFEETFEPENLVLKHQEPKSVILTLTVDSDAPLGQYLLYISCNDGNKGIGATPTITVVE
jgi:hypothetical protein